MRLFEIKRKNYATELTVAQAIKLGRTVYSNYFKLYKDPVSFRGFSHKLPILTSVDASGEERQSANTTNEYTWLLSTLESWQQFPKRSRSLIGSSLASFAASHSFENLASILITPDGGKIGVCPRGDIWESFRDYDNALDLNIEIQRLFSRFELRPKSATYDDFINKLKALNSALADFKKNNSIEAMFPIADRGPIINAYVYDKSQQTYVEMLNKYLAPAYNRFRLVTTETLGSVGKLNEIWTSDRCLIISPEDRIKQNKLSTYKGIRATVLSRK